MSHVICITPARRLVAWMLCREHLCATLMSKGAQGQPCCMEGCGERAGQRWPSGRRPWRGAGPQIPGGVLCTHALSRPAVFAQQGVSRPGGEGGRSAPTKDPPAPVSSTSVCQGGSLSYVVCCCRLFNKMLESPGA